MNYENKAIYNNGIIIRRQQSGDYMVELVTSVPRDGCTITLATPYSQPKNYINYTYEQSAFHSNPVHFFESIGYKTVLLRVFSNPVSSISRWSTTDRWVWECRWWCIRSMRTCR